MLNRAVTQRDILLFWAPLAAQWIMMALEGPFLAAIIARMGEPTFNLAAYGVAFAFAILVESPVIMLMSASTAMVEDAVSFRRMRNFTAALNIASTALLLAVLLPPVYSVLMTTLVGLPDPVTERVYGALWLLLPWPAAIGYRRFLHGVLIRSGRTRLVAYGTVLRLCGMTATALALFAIGSLPGAWVGAAALSAGVCTEALAAHVMARTAVRELLGPGVAASAQATAVAGPGIAAEDDDDRSTKADGEYSVWPTASDAPDLPDAHSAPLPIGAHHAPGYAEIGRFYLPLVLTSFIGLTVQPILTFFMGRSPSPVASLAVFPVVHALSFLFRAPGFSFQEAAIALAGPSFRNARALARFGATLALAASGGLAIVTFTPLADVWFSSLSGLPPDLAALAVDAARFVVPMPALAVALAFQQAMLVKGRTTRPITWASAIEVASIAALFTAFGWGGGMTGVKAAMIAIVGGRLVGNLVLAPATMRVLRGR